MACTNCEVLRERIRELERELGHRVKQDDIVSLTDCLHVTPLQARMLLHLHKSPRRWTSTTEFVERGAAASPETVRAQFHHMRYRAGVPSGLWESHLGRIGGYRLTPAGHEALAAALSSAGLPPSVHPPSGSRPA